MGDDGYRERQKRQGSVRRSLDDRIAHHFPLVFEQAVKKEDVGESFQVVRRIHKRRFGIEVLHFYVPLAELGGDEIVDVVRARADPFLIVDKCYLHLLERFAARMPQNILILPESHSLVHVSSDVLFSILTE